MLQDIKVHYIFWLAVVLVIGGSILGKIAWEQHKAIVTADAKSAADDVKIAAASASIAALAKSDAQQQQATQSAKRQVKTSTDAATVISAAEPIAAAPGKPVITAPQTFQVPRSYFTPAALTSLPTSPDYVVQTQDEAVATAQDLLQCKADRASLTSCQQQAALMTTQISLLRNQSDTWEKAAKGGSKTRRFFKFVECAAAAGGGAYLGSLSKQPMYAAAGAVGGATACQLLF